MWNEVLLFWLHVEVNFWRVVDIIIGLMIVAYLMQIL